MTKQSSKNRRAFIRQSATGILATSLFNLHCMNTKESLGGIEVIDVKSAYEKEPLAKPFGFKGSQITNIWQSIAQVKSSNGHKAIGLGSQSVLWSDSEVFANHTEDEGNKIMFSITEKALDMIKGKQFVDPMQFLDNHFDELYAFGQEVTKKEKLRKTFILNAMVPVDNAMWLLYAAENGLNNFDDLVFDEYKPGLSARHNKVVSIPALGYGTSMETIKHLADQGYFIMKIKIGAPGTQEEMLAKDIEFLDNIHKTIGHYETAYSQHGKIPYYFDANGRYDSKDSLHRFLDHAEKIGALEQIAVLEEPFGERNQDSVKDLVERGPRVAADESAHTDIESLERIEQGYNAIAVKAVAKTLSMTIKIAQVAYEHQVPCFCADLTVNPLLVDWNKSVAARLPAFPEMKGLGLQETNGWQNYLHWDQMMNKLPMKNASWVKSDLGVYHTNSDFFDQSAGIFKPSAHYEKLMS